MNIARIAISDLVDGGKCITLVMKAPSGQPWIEVIKLEPGMHALTAASRFKIASVLMEDRVTLERLRGKLK